jgi:hypothetical protein
MSEEARGVGHELLALVVGLEIEVLDTKSTPTTDGDLALELTCRIDEEDVEAGAFGILFAVGVLSFHEARPAGSSVIDYAEEDEFTTADLLRHLQFTRGELELDTDYVRGRRMKTRASIRQDGRLLIETRGRDLAAQRWVLTLQGKRLLRLVTEAPPE